MPVYTYRREDGSTFDIRQKFSDDPLTVDPETGQSVKRIVHAAGIIFKGSGFYVTDTKKATNPANPVKSSDSSSSDTKSETGSDSNSSDTTDTKSEKSTAKTDTSTTKSESKSDTKAS